VCEHSPPYRAVELRTDARLITDGVEEGGDDLLIRLEPGHLRTWDFADDLA
jgi:hypothetical protein